MSEVCQQRNFEQAKFDFYMAEELLQQIDQLDDSKLKIILQNLAKLLKEKDDRIVTLENNVTDMEIRMSEQERYSSKDCLIVYNPPVTNEGNLWVEMAAFFSSYMDYECNPDLFKACHPTVAGVNKWAATAIKRKPKGPLETPAPSSKKAESVLKRLREESTDEKKT